MPGGVILAASGARLSAMAYSAGGALLLRDFHDEVLDLSCAFGLDAGGTPRCFPQRTLPLYALVFEDAACQQLAVWLVDGMKEGDWATQPVEPSLACDAELPNRGPLFEVGEFLREPEPWISPDHHPAYELIDGRCEPVGSPTKSRLPLHRVIPHHPSELVAGELVSSQGNAELRVRRIVAEDGAQLNLRATLADGASCKLLSDGSCVPEPVAERSWDTWLDAACSTPALAARSSLCGPPQFGVVVDGSGRERVVELRLQPGFTNPLVSHECVPFNGSVSVFAAGPDVSRTLFPRAESLVLGQGELRSDALRVGSYVLPSVREVGPEFRDVQGKPCAVRAALDGTLRCVDEETQLYQLGYRADETCTTFLYARTDSAKVAFTPELLARSFVVEYGREGVSSVSSARLHHGDVYAVSGEECVRVAPDEPLLRAQFGEHPTVLLVPDRPLSLDVFPRVELVRL